MMTVAFSLIHTILLSSTPLVFAWQLPPCTLVRSSLHSSPRLTTNLHQSQLLELFQKRDKATFSSVEDFDEDLADEIRDALRSAGVVDGAMKRTSVSAASAESKAISCSDRLTQVPIEKELVQSSLQGKAPKMHHVIPPHTSLAQVVAYQLNIELKNLTPSQGKKITASDVTYHAWKMSQPPSTQEALARAYQIGLDLNTMYDDEDEKYVMQLSDVQLFEDNSRSLGLVAQKRRGALSIDRKTKQRMKKMSALDERVQKRMEILTRKLGDVASGIMKTVILDTNCSAKKHGPENIYVDDFDASLAAEIQFITAKSTNEHIVGHQVTELETKPTPVTMAVNDFDRTLVIEIQKAVIPKKNIKDIHIDGIDADRASNALGEKKVDENEQIQVVQKSMTAAEIKEQLRMHGVNTSGKKCELAKRLCRVRSLQTLTKEHLKHSLRDRGLKVGGKKAELVERLIFAEENDEDADDSLFFVDMH